MLYTCDICNEQKPSMFQIEHTLVCAQCVDHELQSAGEFDTFAKVIDMPRADKDERPIAPLFRLIPREKKYLKILGNKENDVSLHEIKKRLSTSL